MRILWIASAFYPAVRYGGNVTQAWEECRALAKAGATIEVLTIETEDVSARVVRETHLAGIRVRYHPRTVGERRGLSLDLMRDAFRRASTADIVQLNSPWQLANAAAALGARRGGRPYVISLRGTLMPYALAQHRLRKSAYLAAVEGHVIAGAAAILASNDRERAAVHRRWPSVEVAVLPPVVDVERYARPPGTDIRARYGIPLSAPLILFVGRNHPVKGLDLLLTAFRQVLDAAPEARLLVAGPDERGTVADVRTLAERAGVAHHVVTAGMLTEDDKVAAYHAADVVAMPSRQEGFGQVAAEAMAAGRAVVVTAETGIAPIVEESGAGLVVPVDASAIARALIRLVADPMARVECGRRGAASAADRFSGGGVSTQMLALYEHLQHGRGT